MRAPYFAKYMGMGWGAFFVDGLLSLVILFLGFMVAFKHGNKLGWIVVAGAFYWLFLLFQSFISYY